MELVSRIRFYHFISGVLANQQADPLCSKCKPLVNTVSALRESLDSIKNEHHDELKSLPEDMFNLYEEAANRIASLKTHENSEGQKKAGNCKMPKGVCFIKSSKSILTLI